MKMLESLAPRASMSNFEAASMLGTEKKALTNEAALDFVFRTTLVLSPIWLAILNIPNSGRISSWILKQKCEN